MCGNDDVEDIEGPVGEDMGAFWYNGGMGVLPGAGEVCTASGKGNCSTGDIWLTCPCHRHVPEISPFLPALLF